MANTPYEAVILAAGRGSRLSVETDKRPKALLPIGLHANNSAVETSFLRRQVEICAELGVERIIVVVGYMRDMIIDDIKTWSVKPDIVVNDTPDIGISGSLHSFQFAQKAKLGVLSGSHQTLLMDADIVYHRDVLKTLIDADEESTILISQHVVDDQEEVLAWGDANEPRFLGKGLTSDLTGGLTCLGEATGIIKIAPRDHMLALKIMDWMLGDPNANPKSLSYKGFGPAKRATEHEELTQRLMLLGKMRALYFDKDLPFMEVDSPDEYRILRDSFYPQLMKMEHRL